MRHVLLVLALGLSSQALFAEETAEIPATPPEVNKVEATPAAAPVTTPAPAPAKAAAAAPAPTPAKPAADTKLGQITQIFRDKKKAVVTLDSHASAETFPSAVVVTVGSGEACEGKVSQVKNGKAMVDFAECSSFAQVKSGAAVTASPFAEAPAATKEEPAIEPVILKRAEKSEPQAQPEPEPPIGPAPRQTRFVLSMGYHAGTSAEFDTVSYSGTSGNATGKTTFTVSPALRFSAGAMSTGEYQWGYYAGFTYEQKRELKSEKDEINGSTTTGTYSSPRPTLQMSFLEVNAIYRWTYVYLPFGLNYTLPIFDPSPNSGSTVEARGSIGAQVGVGFFLNENFHLELYSQVLSSHISVTQGGDTADYGIGMLGGLALRAGFAF